MENKTTFKTEQKVFDINFGFGKIGYVDDLFKFIRVTYKMGNKRDNVYYDLDGRIKHTTLTSNIPTLCVREYTLSEIGNVENINSQIE